jgi:hypothetical protein
MNRGPEPNPHAHDHEYRPVEDRFPLFEDGAAIFFFECEYTEITGSVTDHERDETYYSEGYSCDETKTIRFDLKKMHKPVEFEQELVKEAEDDGIPEEVWVGIEELPNGADGYFDPETEDEYTRWLDDNIYVVFEKNE